MCVHILSFVLIFTVYTINDSVVVYNYGVQCLQVMYTYL